jgi:hypothetical protein
MGWPFVWFAYFGQAQIRRERIWTPMAPEV